MTRVGFAVQLATAAALGFGIIYFSAIDGSLNGIAAVAAGECTIKGNVSIDTGERIYHVPGQTFYLQTRIDPQHGERWFCSETEAMMAGWRKSRR